MGKVKDQHMGDDNANHNITYPEKEFYGRWKFSKKRQAWVWKWKNRKIKGGNK